MGSVDFPDSETVDRVGVRDAVAPLAKAIDDVGEAHLHSWYRLIPTDRLEEIRNEEPVALGARTFPEIMRKRFRRGFLVAAISPHPCLLYRTRFSQMGPYERLRTASRPDLQS